MTLLASLSLAQAASVLATRLSMVAIPWMVLTELGNPFLAGMVAFAELAPYVGAKALGGPLIDRLGARRVSAIADLSSAPAFAALPLLHTAGLLTPPLLIVLVAILGLLRGPGDAAKYALVPAVTAAGGYPLSRVAGIQATMDRLGGLLGAVAAAGLIATIGTAQTLWAAAALVVLSGLAVVVGLALISPAPQRAGRYFEQFFSGWRFLRKEPVLLAVTAMIAVTNMLDHGMAVVLTPVWAEQSGGIGWLGTAQVAFGIGAVGGSLIASALAERLPRLSTYVLCYAMVGLPRYLLLTADLTLWGTASGLMLTGFCAGFINPIISVVIFERIPSSLTGRVTSLFAAITWSLMPLGGPAAGALVSLIGLNGALFVFGGIYAVVTAAPILVPAFRAISISKPPPRASAAHPSPLSERTE